jgi:tetratricopeptide (TPR) repeat protein
VIFERARKAALAGDIPGMKAAYIELLRDHPRSGYVPEAYYALADHYFERDPPADAAKLYDRVMHFADAEAAVWATYKLAWCKIRLAEPTDALDHFVQTLRRIDAGDLASTTEAERLAAAVRRDMVRPYAEVGRPDRARAFFEHLGGGKGADDVPVTEQLQLLSSRYAELGRADEATSVCRDLAATHARVRCEP